MTKLKENASEKSEMIADLKEKAVNKFQRYLQAINLWLFIWPFWTTFAVCINHPLEDLAFPIFSFSFHFFIFWSLSFLPKKKKSITSAYTWFCIIFCFVLSFFLYTPLTAVTMLLSVVISSTFFYYFWMGISALEMLSDLKNDEEKNSISTP